MLLIELIVFVHVRGASDPSWSQEALKNYLLPGLATCTNPVGGLWLSWVLQHFALQMAESSPIVLGMLKEASKMPQEALLEHWDLQTSKLVS